MKRIYLQGLHILFLVIFIPCLAVCSAKDVNKLIEEGKIKDRQFVIVERSKVKLWNTSNKMLQPLLKNRSYIYNPSDEAIESPSFCLGNKLLFAKNYIANNKGSLVLINLVNGNETILHTGKRMASPVRKMGSNLSS